MQNFYKSIDMTQIHFHLIHLSNISLTFQDVFVAIQIKHRNKLSYVFTVYAYLEEMKNCLGIQRMYIESMAATKHYLKFQCPI